MLARSTAPLIALQHRDVTTVENATHEATEDTRWPHFDEHPHARLIETFNHAHPTDGLRHLADQTLADRQGVRQQPHRGAAKRGNPWLEEWQRLERRGQSRGRSREQWGMKWAGNGQSLRVNSLSLEKQLHGVNRPRGSADHRLLGSILGTHPDLVGKGIDRSGHGNAIRDH